MYQSERRGEREVDSERHRCCMRLTNGESRGLGKRREKKFGTQRGFRSSHNYCGHVPHRPDCRRGQSKARAGIGKVTFPGFYFIRSSFAFISARPIKDKCIIGVSCTPLSDGCIPWQWFNITVFYQGTRISVHFCLCYMSFPRRNPGKRPTEHYTGQLRVIYKCR